MIITCLVHVGSGIFFSFVAYWNLIIVICNIVGDTACGILAMNLDLVFFFSF